MRPFFSMLTVHAIPVGLYGAKLRILRRHKALAWHEVPPPGGYGSDDCKSNVRSGNLPALVDGDLLLTDTEAIAEYRECVEECPAVAAEFSDCRPKLAQWLPREAA